MMHAAEQTSNITPLSKTTMRVALVALGLLMVPLVASQLVKDWHWNIGAFVLVYVLFFGAGMAYALIARRMDSWAYKAGVAVAMLAGLQLLWFGRVQVADSGHPEMLWYYSVLVVGMVRASISKLRPGGLAWTMVAMVATIGLLAVVLPRVDSIELARRMAGMHAGLVVMFALAGVLFWRARRTT